jgi:hypothetical protein
LGEGEAEGTMTYTTEEFVRREVGRLLRVDYPGKFLCSSCLVKLVLDNPHPGWRKSEIGRAMDKILEAPGALTRMPTFICALCGKMMPCLGVPHP